MDDLDAAKRAVRECVLRARTGMSDEERKEKSAAICAAIQQLPEYRSARSILFYMPVRGEVDMLPLLDSALKEGRRCALPKCSDGRRLRLYAVNDLSIDLRKGVWGIPEPKEGLDEYTLEDFSAILVPGVAFDRFGWRIGYGAGYYDRLLAGPGVVTIAPAFALQVLDELPRGPYDMPVTIIVTEDGITDCRRAGE